MVLCQQKNMRRQRRNDGFHAVVFRLVNHYFLFVSCIMLRAYKQGLYNCDIYNVLTNYIFTGCLYCVVSHVYFVTFTRNNVSSNGGFLQSHL